MTVTYPYSTSLNAARRARDLDHLASRLSVDVLVVGGGVTGTGVALDAASRGLSVVLVDRHDLAFGTSRWSSKLVHGGLRYLASGRVGIAYESARERHILMQRSAPHLTRALPMVVPLHSSMSRGHRVLVRAGLLAGDALRVAAGTPAAVLPRSRRISRDRTAQLLPGVRRDGLQGGLLSYDGQLVDDSRLVVALARTAAGHGARVVTRVEAEQLTGQGAVLRDRLSGQRIEVNARAVVNATGVWAGTLVPSLTLRPSRGTHVVLPARTLGDPRAAITVPVPGSTDRFVFALPQDSGRVYAGLTDEPVEGPLPEVPTAPETDIDFLLGTLSRALAVPLDRTDVLGSYAGLRPLLDTGEDASADLSRRHAVLTSPDGVVTVVGGKLTTYRTMAEQAVEVAVRRAGLAARPCRTRLLPLVGAAPRAALPGIPAPERLVARYGTEAVAILAETAADPELAEPVAGGVCAAELHWAVRHEGALDEDDLLDRRTRIGLVPEERALALPAAKAALDACL